MYEDLYQLTVHLVTICSVCGYHGYHPGAAAAVARGAGESGGRSHEGNDPEEEHCTYKCTS